MNSVSLTPDPQTIKSQSSIGTTPDGRAANEKLKLLWIGIGKDDFLLARHHEFVKLLDELQVRHTYQETAGSHAWGVWRGYLADFLPLLLR